MTCIEYEIFDDLLIGNYMKTTLHGDVAGLYPDFSPYVAKFADNGAKSKVGTPPVFPALFFARPGGVGDEKPWQQQRGYFPQNHPRQNSGLFQASKLYYNWVPASRVDPGAAHYPVRRFPAGVIGNPPLTKKIKRPANYIGQMAPD